MAQNTFSILFVCTGNTCRSPMAEGLMQAKIEKLGLKGTFRISSAGVAASAGSPASKETLQLLNSHGIQFDDFQSTQLTKYHLDENDYIFCLSRMHKDAFCRPHPEYREKTLLVGEFLNNGETKDIADPFGLGTKAYKQVEKELLLSIDNIIKFVQENSQITDTLQQ